MWNVQVTHAVCSVLRLLKQAMGLVFLDLQATQYNHHTIFTFLYFVDVPLDCNIFGERPCFSLL